MIPYSVFTLIKSVYKIINEFLSIYKKEDGSGPEVIKLFSCSTLLGMKFLSLINVKMPIIVGILTFMSEKNTSLGLSKPTKAEFLDIFTLMNI